MSSEPLRKSSSFPTQGPEIPCFFSLDFIDGLGEEGSPAPHPSHQVAPIGMAKPQFGHGTVVAD